MKLQPVEIETDGEPIKVFLDGDQWCALQGENIQEGLAYFGPTPENALQGWLKLFGHNIKDIRLKDEAINLSRSGDLVSAVVE